MPQQPEAALAAAEANAKSREKLGLQIEDIAALRKFEPFNRYWLGELAKLRAGAEKKVLEDDKLTKEQREEMRQVARAYAELQTMMARDEATCRGMLR